MLENILSLKNDFDLFVFDVYGVLWDGKKVISGALELLEDLKKNGKKVMIMSNGTVLSHQMEESYAKRGFEKGKHCDVFVTSGEAYHAFVMRDKRALKVYQFGRPSKDLFAGSSYVEVDTPEKADFVYAGVPQTWNGDFWQDYLTLEPFEKELFSLIALKKTLLCANPDKKAFEKQYAEPVVRQGSVAEFYQKNGGDVEFWGKPYGNIYDFALRDEKVDRRRMLMVGDTLETDILGGKNYGMKTLLLRGGISEQNMKDCGQSDLRAYAQALGIVPDYIF